MAWVDYEEKAARKFKNGDKVLTARKITSKSGYFEQFTLVTVEFKWKDEYKIKDDDGNEIDGVVDKDLIPNTEEDKQAVLAEELAEEADFAKKSDRYLTMFFIVGMVSIILITYIVFFTK